VRELVVSDQNAHLYRVAESLPSECIGRPVQSADQLSVDFTKRDVGKWLAKKKIRVHYFRHVGGPRHCGPNASHVANSSLRE